MCHLVSMSEIKCSSGIGNNHDQFHPMDSFWQIQQFLTIQKYAMIQTSKFWDQIRIIDNMQINLNMSSVPFIHTMEPHHHSLKTILSL